MWPMGVGEGRRHMVDGDGSHGDAADSRATVRPRTRLVRWVRPTRGYVIAAATGAVIALAGIGGQLWSLWTSAGPRPPGAVGWSLVSIAVLVLGAAVKGWGAAWPKPHVPGDDPGRARNRDERRAVRRP